jgi:hypothetical protein
MAMKSMIRMVARVAGLAALAALPAEALIAAPADETLGVAFGDMRIACARAPSAVCANRVTALLDGNGDGRIVPAELDETRRRALAEARQKQTGLTDSDRGMVAIAIAAIDSAGLDTVFAGFDANRDGGIDRGELFADFRLDNRPFAEIVNDPQAVDWPGFADRFGETGRMFLPLLLKAGR